jgi:hypothetical protein
MGDILVNNAGIGPGAIRPDSWQRPLKFWEITADQWRRFVTRAKRRSSAAPGSPRKKYAGIAYPPNMVPLPNHSTISGDHRKPVIIINLPPRHLKSLLASIAFPAWCLGRDPSAQILCVSYAQDLADKLARDCRSIMMSPWYRQIFPTRLALHRQAVQEFITTRQGYRLATSTGGVLTAHTG